MQGPSVILIALGLLIASASHTKSIINLGTNEHKECKP